MSLPLSGAKFSPFFRGFPWSITQRTHWVRTHGMRTVRIGKASVARVSIPQPSVSSRIQVCLNAKELHESHRRGIGTESTFPRQQTSFYGLVDGYRT